MDSGREFDRNRHRALHPNAAPANFEVKTMGATTVYDWSQNACSQRCRAELAKQEAAHKDKHVWWQLRCLLIGGALACLALSVGTYFLITSLS